MVLWWMMLAGCVSDEDLDKRTDRDQDQSTSDVDCDDNNAAIHPSATELCNGIDDNCDGVVDGADAVGVVSGFADVDGDGAGGALVSGCELPETTVAEGGDCNDDDASVGPGQAERCNDADDDCDGDKDEGLATHTWFADADGDGFGDAAVTVEKCVSPTGFVDDATDCDDADSAVFPGAEDAWYDGLDSNCDDADDYDADADGALDPSGGGDDCDDTNSAIHPGAIEVYYDGVDANCDGQNDDDADGDGFASRSRGGADCDDDDADLNPAVDEVCDDGVDNDCDGGANGCGWLAGGDPTAQTSTLQVPSTSVRRWGEGSLIVVDRFGAAGQSFSFFPSIPRGSELVPDESETSSYSGFSEVMVGTTSSGEPRLYASDDDQLTFSTVAWWDRPNEFEDFEPFVSLPGSGFRIGSLSGFPTANDQWAYSVGEEKIVYWAPGSLDGDFISITLDGLEAPLGACQLAGEELFWVVRQGTSSRELAGGHLSGGVFSEAKVYQLNSGDQRELLDFWCADVSGDGLDDLGWTTTTESGDAGFLTLARGGHSGEQVVVSEVAFTDPMATCVLAEVVGPDALDLVCRDANSIDIFAGPLDAVAGSIEGGSLPSPNVSILLDGYNRGVAPEVLVMDVDGDSVPDVVASGDSETTIFFQQGL